MTVELHNSHVALFYTFKAHVAKMHRRWMAAEFFEQWAHWERIGWPKNFRGKEK